MNLLFPDDPEEELEDKTSAVKDCSDASTTDDPAEHQAAKELPSEIDKNNASVQLAEKLHPSKEVAGLLFIGDPHLEARVPGFRCDNYPEVVLNKLRWCLNYAKSNNLQPFLLGDVFQLPQDNPNWLLAEIIDCIDEPLPAIYGNHDVRENFLKPNDSINVLFRSGHLKRIEETSVWVATVAGRRVIVGGSDWGNRLPKSLEANGNNPDLVVWMTHHDILIPGYEEGGRIRPKAIPGIDVIINGHIHRRLTTVVKENTHWFTPGNISRRSRSDASREHRPSVLVLRPPVANLSLGDVRSASDDTADESRTDRLRLDLQNGQQWLAEWITVPHKPFEEVFHQQVQGDDQTTPGGSGFIADLKELTARRTETGAGLMSYLQSHLQNYDEPVAAEVRRLAEEVINGQTAK